MDNCTIFIFTILVVITICWIVSEYNNKKWSKIYDKMWDEYHSLITEDMIDEMCIARKVSINVNNITSIYLEDRGGGRDWQCVKIKMTDKEVYRICCATLAEAQAMKDKLTNQVREVCAQHGSFMTLKYHEHDWINASQLYKKFKMANI